MKVIIDSGHGGKEPGASAFGMVEKDLNLVFSNLLASKLEHVGLEVDKSLINDNYYSPIELTDNIKQSGAQLCISCHNNAFNGSARGFEVIHSIHSKGELATLILSEVKKTGFTVRRAFSRESSSRKGSDYYYVIRLTHPEVETVIVEFGFLDNIEDFKLLNDPSWQNKLTTAVSSAIYNYLSAGNNSCSNPLGKAL
jgi:N-acetylmuramoyl-L-alanine amidase